MQVEMPFYESPEDALKAAVQALGGSKSVGPMLWPDKGVDASALAALERIHSMQVAK